MKDTSIKGLKDKQDKTRKELKERTDRHGKTAKDGVEFMKKVGKLSSGLSDVANVINKEINSQVGNVKDAVTKEDADAQRSADTKVKEKAIVDKFEKDTRAEQKKAESIKSDDKRFTAGKLAEKLQQAGKKLSDISDGHNKDLGESKSARDKAKEAVNKVAGSTTRK